VTFDKQTSPSWTKN